MSTFQAVSPCRMAMMRVASMAGDSRRWPTGSTWDLTFTRGLVGGRGNPWSDNDQIMADTDRPVITPARWVTTARRGLLPRPGPAIVARPAVEFPLRPR